MAERIRITDPVTGVTSWTTRDLYDSYWSGLGWVADGEAPGPVVPPEQPPAGASGEPQVWLEVGPDRPSWSTPGLWVETAPGGGVKTIWIEDGK